MRMLAAVAFGAICCQTAEAVPALVKTTTTASMVVQVGPATGPGNRPGQTAYQVRRHQGRHQHGGQHN